VISLLNRFAPLDRIRFLAAGQKITMTARIIDGKAVAEQLKYEIGLRVAARTAAGKRAPGLAVILVGNDPASEVYVGNKRRSCKAAGFHSLELNLAADAIKAY
jgi:methylenetetrahydrofolate dehydrogenase (NADP+)/methenyltetrahydrofolate cyclohydrolase